MENYDSIYKTIVITSKTELKRATKMRFGTIIAKEGAKETVYKVLHPWFRKNIWTYLLECFIYVFLLKCFGIYSLIIIVPMLLRTTYKKYEMYEIIDQGESYIMKLKGRGMEESLLEQIKKENKNI